MSPAAGSSTELAMSEPSLSVVAEVEAFCERWNADPQTVQASGLKNTVDDATTNELAAVLVARCVATEPTESPQLRTFHEP